MIEILLDIFSAFLVIAVIYGLYEAAWFLRDYLLSRKEAVLQARMEAMRVSQELSWLAWQARLAMREEVRRHEQDPSQQ